MGPFLTLSQAAAKANAKGQRDCLIARHDIRVAFFHAKATSSRLEMCESVVRNTRGEQVLGK